MKKLLIFLFLFPVLVFAQTEAILLDTWNDPSLPGSSAFNNTYNEIWGLSVNGREFAVIGSTAGTHFIDVTDPTNISEVQFVAGEIQGPQIIHRDYHDYGDYLYAVSDEGASSLQIIDISQLPNAAPVVYDSGTLFRRAHNIFIDESGCRLYTLFTRGGSHSQQRVQIFSLEDPTNPVYLSGYNSVGGVSLSGTHDGYIQNDIAYLNLGYPGLAIIDFSDYENPVLLGDLTSYQQQGYNHSCWLDNNSNYLFFADETHGMDLKSIDVSDPANLEVSAFFNSGSTSSNSIAHNVIAACDKLYVSYYYDGLQVFDISDPTNPTRIAFYDTYTGPTNPSYEGAWGVYPFLPSGNILLSDMQTGLYVFQGFDTNCKTTYTPVCNDLITNTHNLEKGVENVILSPQPVSSDFNLNITAEQSGLSEIRLVDYTGKVIQNFGEQAILKGKNNLYFEVDDKIAIGMYFIQVEGVINFSKKLLIVR